MFYFLSFINFPRSYACFFFLYIASFSPLFAGDTLSLPTFLSDQHESTNRDSSLPNNLISQPTPNPTNLTSVNYSFFESLLKGLAYTLYSATRYAVSHPRKLLALGLAAHILPIAAQTGNDFIINQNTTNTQDSPSVAGLINGNVFVAWEDDRAGNDDIYGRVFFPNGSALGSEFIINPMSNRNQKYPSVTGLINGNVFVAWQDSRVSAFEIYGRVFFPNGTALGNDFIINQVITNNRFHPSAESLINGNVFVAWEDQRSGGPYDIYGRIIFPNGTALGNESIINQITTNSQYSPSVAGLINGNIFVTWRDDRSGGPSDIYGRVFFPDGTALGSEFLIHQITTNNQWYPSVAGLINDNVFVAWEDYRANYNSAEIYGRVLFPNGTAMGNEFIINQITTNDQRFPSVVCLINGNVLVTWQDSRTGTDSDIYGRVFLPNGTPLVNEFIINQITTNNQYTPSVASLINGNVFVAWSDEQTAVGNSDIYGRVFPESDLVLLAQNSFTASSSLFSLPSSSPSSSTLNPSTTSLSLSVTPTMTNPGTAGTGSLTTSSSQVPSNPNSFSDINSVTSSISTLASSLLSSTPSSSSNIWSSEIPSSTSFPDDTSWQIPAAVGGTLGAAALIGGVSAVVAKKYCAKGKIPGKSHSSDSDVELEENTETPSLFNRETPMSNLSPFEAKSVGFTKHPTFIGTIHGHTYEIWTKLSRKEAKLVRPLTSIAIPKSSKKIRFTLGRGHFGVTYVGRNPQTKEIFAIKEVHGQEAVDESLREGKIVHSLGEHSHITHLVDYIRFKPSETDEEPRLLQVMPLAYINGTSFKELLTHSNNADREKIVADSLWQMMRGLQYLHKKGVVHLDIKADNTLYMKDGTLRIADFGRAQQVGNNDHIADINSLGDMRKFSPEILAFIRNCNGETFDIVESFSGKAADVWAAGLYAWELLEDNSDNLYSTKWIPLKKRVAKYTFEAFEQLIEPINTLNQNYSENLISLLRQALTINPEMRLRPSQALKMLSKMSASERKTAFEELIRFTNQHRKASKEQANTVYAFADPEMYLHKLEDGKESRPYVPSNFYTKEEL